jgi:transposase
MLRVSALVHIRDRLCAMRYSSDHETSNFRPYAFRRGARVPQAGPALLRFVRVAPIPDPSCQRPRRTHPPRIAENLGCGSQTVRNAIHAFNAHGLDALKPRSSRPRHLRTAFEEEGAKALREILHQDPRNLGKEDALWTLEYAAQVSFEQGITQRRVTGETIRATLDRLGVRWERAKRWIESPDPEYARKKGLATG